MVKLAAKAIAIQMRKDGHSYSAIKKRVKVSKSTLTVWLANVSYTPNLETRARIGRARAAANSAKVAIKMADISRAADKAEKDIGILERRDVFMLGLGMYIGEGSKSMQETRFVNADASVLRFIVKWFREALEVPLANFSVKLHLYPDTDEEASLAYWSQAIGVPLSQFKKPYIDVRQNKRSIKIGKLPFGTAHVGIRSLGKKEFGVFLARRIMGCMNIVLDKKRD